MGFTEIVKTEEIQLKNAILLEGLPGVGNVGKLAATHLGVRGRLEAKPGDGSHGESLQPGAGDCDGEHAAPGRH